MEKYYQCGREQIPLNEDIIQSLRNNKEFSKLHRVLGTMLFIKWLYISNFISHEDYSKMSPLSNFISHRDYNVIGS